MQTIERGDSLHDKTTDTLWLVMNVQNDFIALENIRGEKIVIGHDELSNYQLIKSQD